MNIHILESAKTEEARAIWRALETTIKDITLAASWVWTETWIETYGDFIPYFFIVAYEEKKPVGIVLITKETGRTLPFPVNSYSVGTGGEPLKERTHILNKSILVDSKHHNEFIALIVEHFRTHIRWEELTMEFYRNREYTAFLSAVKTKKLKHVVIREYEYIRDLVAIRTAGGSVFDALPSSTKYKVKRSLKGFGNDVFAEYGKTVDQTLEIYHEMIDLHQKVWERRGKRGMFASPRFRQFHESIIRKLYPTGGANMIRVQSKRFGTIGCIYLLIDRGEAMMYQTGFNTFDGVTFEHNTNKNKIKPGLVSHAYGMQLCMDELGIDIYNYGPAEYQYKNELTDDGREVFRLSVQQGVKPLLRDAFWDLYIKADSNTTAQKLLRPFYELYKRVG